MERKLNLKQLKWNKKSYEYPWTHDFHYKFNDILQVKVQYFNLIFCFYKISHEFVFYLLF